MFSNSTVGEQHEFLDELRGIIRFLEVRTDRFTLFINIKVQFLAVELDGTALETTFTKFLGQFVQCTQFLGIGVSTRLTRFTRGTRFQNILHFLIGVSPVTLYDSMDNAVVLDVGFIVQSEDYTIAELFFVRTQRTDEVTEALRQHGNGTVDKVDTGGSLRRFFINRRTFLDVMRNIGNMHTNLPQLALFADAQCIIEVLGILGVNGTGKHLAEVLATSNLLGGDARIYLLGSLFHMLGIGIGQSILCKDGMHLDIVIALLT